MAVICVTDLHTASADNCELHLQYGRIDVVLWTRAEPTDALTDATSPSEWADRISNSDALTSSGTPAPIRYLYVDGEWPLPESTAIEVSNGRTAYTTPKNTISLSADDVGATNSALLAAEQGKTKRRKYGSSSTANCMAVMTVTRWTCHSLAKKSPGPARRNKPLIFN